MGEPLLLRRAFVISVCYSTTLRSYRLPYFFADSSTIVASASRLSLLWFVGDSSGIGSKCEIVCKGDLERSLLPVVVIV